MKAIIVKAPGIKKKKSTFSHLDSDRLIVELKIFLQAHFTLSGDLRA